jgi:hypothetical protein
MGVTQSTNVIESTMEAITTTNTTVMQDNSSTQSNSLVITVDHTGKDVVLSGNTFNQTNTVNMNSLNSAAASQSAQADMESSIVQTAYAMNKGLNLFQSSDAHNYTSNYMKSTIDVSNTVSQTCSTSDSNNIDVDVSYTANNVYIVNNTTWQDNEDNTACIQRSLSSQSAINSMQNFIDQSAIAENLGVPMWAVVAIFALVVIMVLGVPIVAALEGLAMVWYVPGFLIAAVGMIFFIIYLMSSGTVDPQFWWYAYSVGIKGDSCGSEYGIQQDWTPYVSIDAAAEAASHTVDAIDFKYDIDPATGATMASGNAMFYTYTGSASPRKRIQKCKTITGTTMSPLLEDGNKPGFRNPQFNQGTKDLNDSDVAATITGDVYLNVNTGQLWYKAMTGSVVGTGDNPNDPPEAGSLKWMTWRDATTIYKHGDTTLGWVPPDESHMFEGSPAGIMIPYSFATATPSIFNYAPDDNINGNRVYFLLSPSDGLWVNDTELRTPTALKANDLYIDVLPYLPTASCMTKNGCFLGWYWCDCDSASMNGECDLSCTCDCTTAGALCAGATQDKPPPCQCCCTPGGCPENTPSVGNKTFVQSAYFNTFMTFRNTGGQTKISTLQKKSYTFKECVSILAGTGKIPVAASTMWTGFKGPVKNKAFFWTGVALMSGGVLIQILLDIWNRSNAKKVVPPSPSPAQSQSQSPSPSPSPHTN